MQILEAAGGCFQQQEIKEEFWSTAERVGAGEQAAGSRQSGAGTRGSWQQAGGVVAGGSRHQASGAVAGGN